MIGYVTLGTNDLPRAAAFYDELLGCLGATRLMDADTSRLQRVFGRVAHLVQPRIVIMYARRSARPDIRPRL